MITTFHGQPFVSNLFDFWIMLCSLHNLKKTTKKNYKKNISLIEKYIQKYFVALSNYVLVFNNRSI